MIDLAELGLSVRSDGVVTASKDLDGLTRSSKRAETASERLTRQTVKTSRAMKSMGRNLTLYVTAPILAAGAASVKLGATFESTLTKMNTLVGVSREELIKFRKEIIALGPSVGRGPVELADALFAITSAGQRGTQALDTLEKAAKASAIGLGDTRQVALAATAAVQAYGTANMDSTKALEIFIGTIEKGNLSAEELVPVMGRVIGIAAEMGVAFEDLGAFIATFSLLGVKADEAATSLRGVLSAIQAPTPDAEQAFKDLGTSIEQVRRDIQENGFIKTFQDIVRESRRLNVDLVSIIPNVRALSGVLGVFGGEGELAEKNLKGVADAVGTLEDRFEAMKELDPTFVFQQMKAELQATSIAISNQFLPPVLEVTKEISKLAEAFNELNPETQTTIVRFGLLAAAIGPLFIVLGSVINVIRILIPLLITLGSRMLVLFGPAGLVVAGITALGLLAFAMYDTEKGASALDLEIENLIRSMNDFGKTSFDLTVQKLNDAIIENETLVDRLQDNFQMLMDMQSMPSGALQSDVSAIQMAELARQIQAAEAEGARLRDQMQRLTEAQNEYNAKINGGNERMARYAATMREMEENFKWLDNLTEPPPLFDAEAFEELVDLLDPSIKATEEFREAWSLLEKAFKLGKIPEAEMKRLQILLQKSSLASVAFGGSIERNTELMKKYADSMREMDEGFKWLEELDALDTELDGLRSQFDPLIDGINSLDEARELLQEGFSKGLIDDEAFERMNENIDRAESSLRLMHDTFAMGLNTTIAALEQTRSLFNENSSAAEGLNSVLQVLNVVSGIYAVIKQLQGGDVYSAIPRALGVAALIASMGVDTGAAGSSSAERTRQESQGTGSVLGDAEEKSESILRATEITADATSELVGINRGMLHALTSLQSGLEGATVQLARNAQLDIALPEARGLFDKVADLIPIGFIGDIVSKLFGGKTKLLDEGLQIEGGMLSDLVNDVFVRAFADIKKKKWVFGSYKSNTLFEDLDSEIGKQLALVFGSIVDTVREAGIALGIPLDAIEDRLASFEMETIKISLMDLNAEEQQEELLAVFSKIFDDIAGHVIPFIGDFQQIGEGMGETLVRVATSVQVFQEAVKALGFAANETDPELFAHMAVGLVELTGGVENFIAQFTSFFDKFASDEQKLEFVTSQVTRAFESVGLEIPETAAGMIDLMNSLDATTEAGREQIAMLLGIADAADEYYTLLENSQDDLLDGAKDMAEYLRTQRTILADFTGSTVYAGLLDLRDSFMEAMDAADALGASQREYAMIARAFNTRLRRMAAELTLTIINTTKQLFGDEMDAFGDDLNDGLNNTREIANSVFTEWQRALEDIYEFTQSILLDENLTTLTPAEQFAEAQSQFDALLQAALAGDQEAALQLPDAAKALLEEARFMFASGQQYTEIFNMVLAALDRISIPDDVPPIIIEEDETVIDDPVSENDVLAEELQKFLLAMDLAETLRDLSQVLNTSVVELAESLNVPLNELVELLGVELTDIGIKTAEGLAEVAMMLGADIMELLDVLDIGLNDLISDLPSAIQADLAPLLQAIEDATTEADATTAIGELGDYILELPEDLQTLLSPLFELFAPEDIAPELGALVGIEENTANTVDAIHALIDTMGGEVTTEPDAMGPFLPDPIIGEEEPPAIFEPSPDTMPDMGPDLPDLPDLPDQPEPPPDDLLNPYILGLFANGGQVEKTGLYQMHAGEFVVTKSADNLTVVPGDDELTQEELAEIKQVLMDIRDQNRKYQEMDLANSREMESSLKLQAETARRVSNA